MSAYVNKKEFIFLIVITVYLSELILHLTVFAGNSELMSALKYVRYFCYLFAVIKILMDGFNQKSIYRIFIILIIITITALQISNRTYLFYLLIIVAAKDVNFRKILKCACCVQGAFLAFFVLGAQMGWITNYLFIQAGGRIRYGLGFFYTALAPTLFFFFMMSYIYLRKERMRIYEFIILEAINYWFYFMTNTRACFYLSSLLLVVVFVLRFYWNHKKDQIRRNRWLVATPSACCIIAILLHACYNPDNRIWVSVNQALNNRLSLGMDAINTYGITLFGQEIEWSGNSMWRLIGDITDEYNFVDSSYLQILLSCGVVFLIIIIAMYTYMIYMAIKMKDYYLQTIILFIVIFSITEPRLFNLAYNPFPLLIASLFRTRNLEELNRRRPALIRRWVF